MKKSVVTHIGEEAISVKDPLIILFDNSATEALKAVSVIQEFETKEELELIVGGKLLFDEQEYSIKQVGPIANDNLKSMGHVTVFFKEITEDDMSANAVYVEPYIVPEIKKGTIISYT
ncbi:MAG: PTS glucitol/sorbitol transporter subunit IIA [Vagococcus sp.]